MTIRHDISILHIKLSIINEFIVYKFLKLTNKNNYTLNRKIL